MTDRTHRAITRLAQRREDIGQMQYGIWLFTDADIATIRALRPGRPPLPGSKPRKRKPKPPPQTQEPTP
jgi:hypothetical protein